jgi:hypothetical protein
MPESWRRGPSSGTDEFRRFLNSEENSKSSPTWLVIFLASAMLVNVYTVALFAVLRVLGVDSVSYLDALIITGCAMVVRYLDAGFIRSAGRG